MKVKRIKSYDFGYDIDAVKDVQDYVIDNYATEDYNIHIARGDDVMNHLGRGGIAVMNAGLVSFARSPNLRSRIKFL